MRKGRLLRLQLHGDTIVCVMGLNKKANICMFSDNYETLKRKGKSHAVAGAKAPKQDRRFRSRIIPGIVGVFSICINPPLQSRH